MDLLIKNQPVPILGFKPKTLNPELVIVFCIISSAWLACVIDAHFQCWLNAGHVTS